MMEDSMLTRFGKVMFSTCGAPSISRFPITFASHQRLVRVEEGLERVHNFINFIPNV